MQVHLIVSFDKYNEPTFLLRVETMPTSLPGNASYPAPGLPECPRRASIVAAVDTYKIAYKAASGGDKTAIKTRKGQRTALTTLLKSAAKYLEIVAAGDTAKLATTGYELSHIPVKTESLEVLGLLLGLKVKQGVAGGSLVVHATAGPRAAVYHLVQGRLRRSLGGSQLERLARVRALQPHRADGAHPAEDVLRAGSAASTRTATGSGRCLRGSWSCKS